MVSVDPQEEGDATVLQLEITLSAPGYLRISFVVASDEHPFWIDDDSPFPVNDGMAIFVRRESNPSTEFENIALLKSPGQLDRPISLRELRDCGPIMFKNHQVAPAPDDDLIPDKEVFDFATSNHGFDTDSDGFNTPDDEVAYYNHEFGGFSKVLTRETPCPLRAGNYTVKIVVQDVFDRSVDTAIFVQADSLKLFALVPGDFDNNGCVDEEDYNWWVAHYGEPIDDCRYLAVSNGDGFVNLGDYVVWRNHLGESGNADREADFNRDGCVNFDDAMILSTYWGLPHCASRFEGDADGDGDVDGSDLAILGQQMDFCSGCAEMAMGGGGDTAAMLKLALPESADVNGNGKLDAEDVAVLGAIVYGDRGRPAPSDDEEPTLHPDFESEFDDNYYDDEEDDFDAFQEMIEFHEMMEEFAEF